MIFLCLLIAFCPQEVPSVAESSGLTHGPFLGHTTEHSAQIWARAGYQCELQLKAVDVVTRWSTTALARAEASADFCVVWKLSQLLPARTYSYRIHFADGSERTGPDLYFRTPATPEEPARIRLAFGSCARTDGATAATWKALSDRDPDTVVLLGDTPYIDSTDLAIQRRRYREFAGFEPMARLLASTPLYSIWDDHDFGANDTDGRLPGKSHSLQAFREYRANASFGGPAGGLYTKFRRGAVEVFLLDTRYFAATEPSPVDPERPSLLGSSQWYWLLEALRASTARFKILASGMIWNGATRPGKPDHWMSYPHEREALFRFLGEHRIEGVVLVAGDIHRSRALLHPSRDVVGYDLVELITSPMHAGIIEAANAPHPALLHDAGAPSAFLLVTVDTLQNPATLRGTALDASGKELFSVTVQEGGEVHKHSAAPQGR
jgi:alkaline phosphatase D